MEQDEVLNAKSVASLTKFNKEAKKASKVKEGEGEAEQASGKDQKNDKKDGE